MKKESSISTMTRLYIEANKEKRQLKEEAERLREQVELLCSLGRGKDGIETIVVDRLNAQVKRLRAENHTLEMMAWEYERVWEWLMENADYTCRKLLLLIEEWKEEDGLVTIDGVTYEKEVIEDE